MSFNNNKERKMTMKKIYQSPMTMVVKVNMKYHLMDPSVRATANPATVNNDGEYNTLSRRGGSDLWDDDED